MGNAGTRNVSQKPEPVNNGNVGKVDESVVMNDNGQNINKGKSKMNENGTSNTGKSNNGSVDSKKSMANNNYGNKNEKEAAKVNKSDKSKKGGNEVSMKDVSGAKNVATSNRFDLLRDDNACEEVDPWKEVKELVVAACNTGVPIDEVVLKNWNEDMIKFYSVKWNNRSKKSGYIKQQLESEMVSLVNQIVQLNRNLNRNSKLNAEKMLKNSVLTTKDASDVSLSKFYDAACRAELAKPLCKLEDLSHIWAEIVSGISIKHANKSIWSVIQRLVFGAAVYYIWQERNGRIFRKEFRSEESVFKVIVDTVRYKLMGLEIMFSREVVKAMAIWKIPVKGVNGSGSMGQNDYADDVFSFAHVGSVGSAWVPVFGDVTKFLIGVTFVVTISYALQRIGLASALACLLVVWSIARYALQNRVRISALAVLF
ncbi:reverse transcriptase domain, Reverse transcriptase zinc-binding domain protein [Artemisia annua]|uniref:Reverse transcriptase domain, Reverse transcriptase zinc-binding domain protein n=1 Tax=Artemisia annua TaxID=35608 RepID=A0A2U1Q461_ARTAN|nr:reverse transcriptase domain, Reverse transcriptase zinc-binding domain protein [Artemisia annua]